MYVDGLLLSIIYVFSASSILISIYTLYTVLELKDSTKKMKPKANNAWDHYHTKASQKNNKPKGYWS